VSSSTASRARVRTWMAAKTSPSRSRPARPGPGALFQENWSKTHNDMQFLVMNHLGIKSWEAASTRARVRKRAAKRTESSRSRHARACMGTLFQQDWSITHHDIHTSMDRPHLVMSWHRRCQRARVPRPVILRNVLPSERQAISSVSNLLGGIRTRTRQVLHISLGGPIGYCVGIDGSRCARSEANGISDYTITFMMF
jgi:hypothetical protein